MTSLISVQTMLHVPKEDRIPSLSRSEVSGTDTSGAASTPEALTRDVAIVTTRDWEDEGDGEERQWPDELQHGEDATFSYMDGNEVEGIETPAANRYGPPSRDEAFSPLKSPSVSYLTPGVPRGRHSLSVYASNAQDTTFHPTVLQDITTIRQDLRGATPFTPSPLSAPSKAGDFTTPRAPLDDAERRKNHVLAVLSSSGLPSRTSRITRGTPHPLRRVSTAPASESIAEEGSPPASHAKTAGTHTQLSIDVTRMQSANDSFVSIASSADLTSDRRATHSDPRLSRGNTSFPTILLPTNAANPSPGGSLKGLSDHRADGVKIHKHLNAMNKQLLESNADLAREAEAWRDEVDRLMGLLKDHGIEIEEVDVVALVLANGSSSTTGTRHHDDSQRELSARYSEGANRKDSQLSPQDLLEGLSPEDHADVMQEMAERLEALEEGLTDKDRLISELRQDLNAARSPADLGSEEIDSLHEQLEEAERARVTLHSDFALKTEQHAKRFGEICSGFEEQVKGFESQLASARGEADRLRVEKTRSENVTLRSGTDDKENEMRKQILSLEVDLNRAREDARARGREVDTLEDYSKRARDEHRDLQRRAEAAQLRVADLEAQFSAVTKDIQEVDALQAELNSTQVARQAAEDDLTQTRNKLSSLQEINADQEAELERQHMRIQDLSAKIRELEFKLNTTLEELQRAEQSNAEVDELRQALREAEDVVAEREEELNSARNKLTAQALHRSHSTASISIPQPDTDAEDHDDQASMVKAMEDQLDNAFREIGRLKHELTATPHCKSVIEVRDARIKALEQEKAALSDRLSSAKKASAALTPIGGLPTASSPFNRPTPFMHKAIASLKTPKTPGPLKDVSHRHVSSLMC